MNDKQIVLITGAGGFLGRDLIEGLLKHNYEVWALTSQKKKVESAFNSDVILFSIDELRGGSINFFLVDVVVHCAFSTKNNSRDLAESLKYTQEVFSQAVKNNVKKIINFSTRSVYGEDSSLLTDESAEISPINEYGLAKYSSELMLELATQQQTSKYVNVRLSSMLGVDSDIRLVNKFVKAAIDNRVINISGGKQKFSFINVRDVVSAIINLLESDEDIWNTTYNLGSNTQNTILELAEMVAREVEYSFEHPVKVQLEKNDKLLTAGMNSSSFYEAISWSPQCCMQQTIAEIVLNYRINKY